MVGQLAKDDDGNLYEYNPVRGRFEPISREELDVEGQSNLRTFGESLVRNARDTVGFVARGVQLDDEFGRGGLLRKSLDAAGLGDPLQSVVDWAAEDDPRQEAIWSRRPGVAGSAIAAEVLVPLGASRLASAPARAVANTARRTADDVVRSNVRTQSRVVQGFRNFKEGVKSQADDMRTRFDIRTGRNTTTWGERSAEVVTDATRLRPGASSVGARQLDDVANTRASQIGNISDDVPLTRGEADWLAAQSADETDAAIRLRKMEEFAARDPANGAGAAIEQAKIDRRRWGTQRVLDETGLADKGHQAFTAEAVQDLFEDSKAVFKKHIDRVDADQQIPTRVHAPAGDGEEVLPLDEFVDSVVDNLTNESAATRKAAKAMKNLAAAGERVSGEEFQTVYNIVRKARDNAFRPGSPADPENGAALNELLEGMVDMLHDGLDDTAKAEIAQARFNWGIGNDLVKGRSIDPNTDLINFRTFTNNRKRWDRLFATSRRRNDRFFADLDMLQKLDTPVTPDPGTASTLLNSQLGRGATALVGSAAAGAGISEIFR